MLEVENLDIRYGPVSAVRALSLTVRAGEIVCLVGANGAGKSSCLKGIMGLARSDGAVVLDGEEVAGMKTDKRVGRGLALVPEGRHVFPDMTITENLKTGIRGTRKLDEALLNKVIDVFPILRERREQKAGTLSGGEQQMLAICRALMSNPKILLLDEPTLGLAPIMVQRVAEVLNMLRAEGMGLLLAEQNLHMALGVADRGYVLETGSVVKHGAAEDLKSDDQVRNAYLGV